MLNCSVMREVLKGKCRVLILEFLEDVLSLPPKCEIENLVGVVPIETCNCCSWEMYGIELFKNIE